MKNITETKLEDFGVLVQYPNSPVPIYDFKKMTEFCEKVGKEKAELTEDERDQFLLYYTK